MPPFIDLIGQKFDELTVTSSAGRKNKQAIWNCACTCNGTTVRTGSDLRQQLRLGRKISCGCVRKNAGAQRTIGGPSKWSDITGQKFGRLTVEAYQGRSRWLCHCSCGGSCVLPGGNLRGGRVASCGCIRRLTPQQQKLRRLRRCLSAQFRMVLVRKGIEKNGRTFQRFGYTPQQLLAHIESKLLPGMTWENRREWHIDHIVPLSSATTLEEVINLFALENLQVLWWWQNISKSNHSMAEWMEREAIKQAKAKRLL